MKTCDMFPQKIPLRFQLVASCSWASCWLSFTAVGAVTIREDAGTTTRDAYKGRLIGVAESVAQLPSVINAFGTTSDQPATIQPIAEVIRQASNVTYVVVTNRHGVRQSHPNPAEIGRPVSTDPSVPLSGEIYVGTQTGTLGESWRVKVPIFDDDGEVMGQVSVGILESELRADFIGGLTGMLAALVVAARDRRPRLRVDRDGSSGVASTDSNPMRSVRCSRPARRCCTASAKGSSRSTTPVASC